MMFLLGNRINLPLKAPNKKGRVTTPWPLCQPPHIEKNDANRQPWPVVSVKPIWNKCVPRLGLIRELGSASTAQT